MQSPAPCLRWCLTLTYLLSIYATLGVVRPIAEQLRTAGLLRPVVTLLFAASAILAMGWRYGSTDRTRLVLRAVLITSLAAITLFMPGLPEERLHFLTYGLLGWLLCWSNESDAGFSRRFWIVPVVLVWIAGGVDELIQLWLPGRVGDIRDMIFNGVAGIVGVALFATGSSKLLLLPYDFKHDKSRGNRGIE